MTTKHVRLGSEMSIAGAGKTFRLIEYCGEGNTGLCVVKETSHELGWAFTIPIIWLPLLGFEVSP